MPSLVRLGTEPDSCHRTHQTPVQVDFSYQRKWIKCILESSGSNTVYIRPLQVFFKINVCGLSYIRMVVKVKVKESRNKPGVAQRVPGGLGSQIS
jgi:hypothetical protein